MPKRDCARCGKHRTIRHGFPDGPICDTCFQDATNTNGTCNDCGDTRMLIGRNAKGGSVCRDCAGITANFECSRCHTEGHIHRNRTCVRCCVRDDLTTLLASNGTVAEPLAPFVDAVIAMRRPQSAMIWLRNPSVREILTGLGNGGIELTHADLDERPEHIKTVSRIRELLVASGALGPLDTRLHRFEQDLAGRLQRIDDTAERAVVKSYVTWKRLRHLRTLAANGQRTESAIRTARQELTVIANLICWLHDNHKSLADCDQATVDRWIVTGPTTRRRCATFIRWAVEHRHITNACAIPPEKRNTTPALSEAERIALLRRLIDPTPNEQLAPRLAAILVLLYGPPLNTIRHLTLGDVTTDGDDTTIQLAVDPAVLPPRIADMVHAQIRHRRNMRTAANPTSDWLFPGQTAGRPITFDQLLARIYELGLTIRNARSAALRKLVLTIPAPVLTTILGYTAATLDRHTSSSGAPWLAYASRPA